MENNTEKKQPVRNLERVAEKKFKTYEDAITAKQAQIAGTKPTPDKVKIFARYDGTFDVVVYRKIKTFEEKMNEVGEAIKAGGPRRSAVIPVVHGQKSKDRKKSPKKERQ